MTKREVLPNRRASITFEFWHGSFQYRATTGFYPDGRIGEVFLNAAKTGTELDVATRDSAIALSFALQHGCRIETVQSAMTRGEQGEALGALGVLVDLLAQHEAEMVEAMRVAAASEEEPVGG